jgi:hypothetical protein
VTDGSSPGGSLFRKKKRFRSLLEPIKAVAAEHLRTLDGAAFGALFRWMFQDGHEARRRNKFVGLEEGRETDMRKAVVQKGGSRS